jgi:hypothetical protein
MQARRLVEILVNDMRASFLDQEARGRRPRAGAGAVNAGIAPVSEIIGKGSRTVGEAVADSTRT